MGRNGYRVILSILVLAAGWQVQAQSVPTELGNFSETLEQIKLENTQGATVPLAIYKDQPLTLLILLAHDCPICQQYGSKFRELSQQSDQLRVIGIAPGDGTTREVMEQYRSKYNFDFPILLDPQKVLPLVLKAKVTPEVFLFNRQGDLLYRGKIDNWFYELGKHRNVVTEHYLDNAIAAALAGEPVNPNKTEPIGCLLNMGMQHH